MILDFRRILPFLADGLDENIIYTWNFFYKVRHLPPLRQNMQEFVWSGRSKLDFQFQFVVQGFEIGWTNSKFLRQIVHQTFNIAGQDSDFKTVGPELFFDIYQLSFDKFVGFVDDLEKLGQRLDQAQTSYHDAFNKLKSGKGNLIRTAEKVRELGVKPSKNLSAPLIESSTDTE